MTIRHKHIDMEAAKASAREAASRRTCEGCAALRIYPRPMCAGEASAHFRTARDTYHERCAFYTVKDMAPPTVVEKAPPPKAKPAKLVKLRGVDRVVSEEEYDRLMARNRLRRVGA